jgi:glyoxylase-like metal-dependent hydrolase (beta-lactamase superfamily II)
MHRVISGAIVTLALLVPAAAVAQQAAQPPTRSLTQITGQLYRGQNNNAYNVVLVTPEGVIVTDPINKDFSLWLKQEIAQRFKAPVRYVLYTHHHWDHASGGEVFADTAEFVGHVSMIEALSVPAGNIPLSAAMQKFDTNKNGVLERSEATGQGSPNFVLTDANGDGLLSGAEIQRGPVTDVYPATMTFTGRHTVTLGGKSVEMIHLGGVHAPDSSVIYFPAERTLVGGDMLRVRRMPFNIEPGPWHNAMRIMMAVDFDHAAPGHGVMGTKQDIGRMQQYIADVTDGVVAGIAAGRSLADIQKSLTLEKYKDFEGWEMQRPNHIANVYAAIKGTP